MTEQRRPDREEMFRYLDALRESGVTNMFGAGRYLEHQFALSRGDAAEVLGEWMRTFDARHPEEGEDA